jgi:SAM-dependent methyltransferase
MKTQKQNVNEFNADIHANSGYRYTNNAPYSSKIANARITTATAAFIGENIKSIIDIGCGDGTYTHELQTRFPGIHFTGIDPAAVAIELAKVKFELVHYLVGDLLDPTTFPETKFDLGIVRGVLHHLPDASQGIINATKLSDKILIIEPNGNNPILKWLEKHSQYHIDHEEQSFTSAQLVQWCRASGYQILSIDFIGFVPFFFPTPLAKIIHFFQPVLEWIYPLKKYFGAQIIIAIEKVAARPSV